MLPTIRNEELSELATALLATNGREASESTRTSFFSELQSTSTTKRHVRAPKPTREFLKALQQGAVRASGRSERSTSTR